jgi:hypothetical protein
MEYRIVMKGNKFVMKFVQLWKEIRKEIKMYMKQKVLLKSIFIPEASLIDCVRVVLNTISHSGD